MNKWTNPELEELSLSLTAGNGHGNTGNGSKNHPKNKTEQYEQGHNYNFVLAPNPEETQKGYEGEEDYTDLDNGSL